MERRHWRLGARKVGYAWASLTEVYSNLTLWQARVGRVGIAIHNLSVPIEPPRYHHTTLPRLDPSESENTPITRSPLTANDVGSGFPEVLQLLLLNLIQRLRFGDSAQKHGVRHYHPG